MKIFYADQFVLRLPPGHRFPMQKYAMLRERVAAARFPGARLVVPDAVRDDELARVHEPAYIRRVVAGALSPAEVRRIGFPWSPELVERSRRSVGGTLGASRAALVDGVGVNLAGGTHHAFPDAGEGFCVFNDVAVAARAMQAEGLVRRAAVVDTDVHQGNGTAAIFRWDPSVFTFSVHGARNYPFRKETSDLDVELPDGAGDDEFLDAVERGVLAALAAGPELVYYLAGADACIGDRLGRLAVSKEGLAERDRIVLGSCREAGVAVVVVMGGGYGREIEDTVDVHFHSVSEAASMAAPPATSTSR